MPIICKFAKKYFFKNVFKICWKIISIMLKYTCLLINEEINSYLKQSQIVAQYAGVAEWQTHKTQNLARATSWGFDPLLRHHTSLAMQGFFYLFNTILISKTLILVKKRSILLLFFNLYSSLIYWIRKRRSLKFLYQFLQF